MAASIVHCYKCNKRGHLATNCTRTFMPCRICKSVYHHQVNCHHITKCLKGKCSIAHHTKLPCDLTPCARCGLVTHKTEVCAEFQCIKCNSFTHLTEDCGKPIKCFKCNSDDHTYTKCILCFKCKEWGHKIADCKKIVVFLYK